MSLLEPQLWESKWGLKLEQMSWVWQWELLLVCPLLERLLELPLLETMSSRLPSVLLWEQLLEFGSQGCNRRARHRAQDGSLPFPDRCRIAECSVRVFQVCDR